MSQVPDKDYLEYLRASGTWTDEQKLMWAYLSTIVDLLQNLSDGQMMQIDPNKPNLMGQFRIQPQSTKGIRHGPPPPIL